jgi:hypothetical protein
MFFLILFGMNLNRAINFFIWKLIIEPVWPVKNVAELFAFLKNKDLIIRLRAFVLPLLFNQEKR